MVVVEENSGVAVPSSLRGVVPLSSLRAPTLSIDKRLSESHFQSLSQARHNSSPLHKGQEQEEVRHFLEKLISHLRFPQLSAKPVHSEGGRVGLE